MRTYLVVWFNSEGGKPSDITQRLLSMGFIPQEGQYDYVYEWSSEASVDDILHAARGILRKKGRLALIYPAERLVDIVARMRRFNLEPKRVRINYPTLRSSANLALIEASLGGKPGLEILPPLIGQGSFSAR